MIRIEISPNVIEDVMKTGKKTETFVCEKGLPNGYILVGADFNKYSRNLSLVFDKELVEDLIPEFKRCKND